jgi:hypothetical protein
MIGLGLSVSLTPSGAGFLRGAAQLIYNDYYNRVTADGGTVEGESCFERAVFLLGVRNSINYTDLIFQRWTADGATVEAESCFNNSFFSLNS